MNDLGTAEQIVQDLLATDWQPSAFVSKWSAVSGTAGLIQLVESLIAECYRKSPCARDGLARFAFLLWGEGRRKEARHLWKEDIGDNRISWRQYLRYADTYVETDDLDRAKDIVRQVYEQFPDAKSGYAGLGWRMRHRDPEHAKLLFQEDSNVNRVCPEFLAKFAVFFAQQEDFGEAREALSKTLAMDPQSRVIHQVAEVFQVKGRFDEVVDLYRNAPTDNWFNREPLEHGVANPKDNESLFAFYDLLGMAPTFDAVTFLGHAERARQQRSLSGIRIVIVPATPQRFPQWYPVDQQGQAWRLQNIVLPLCSMLPTCTGFSVCATRDEAVALEKSAAHVYPGDYRVSRPTQDFYYLSRTTGGYPACFIEPSPSALRSIEQRLDSIAQGRKPIVITLREANLVSKQRNSNTDQWLRFVHSLDAKRFLPIVLRDQDKAFAADEEWLPFQHFPEAVWNLELRAALYETAYLNLGVANGPMAFSMANPRTRMLMFKNACSNAIETSRELRGKNGFEVGEQPPFVTRFQKFVWEDDTYEVIRREFDAMVDLIERNGETE